MGLKERKYTLYNKRLPGYEDGLLSMDDNIYNTHVNSYNDNVVTKSSSLNPLAGAAGGAVKFDSSFVGNDSTAALDSKVIEKSDIRQGIIDRNAAAGAGSKFNYSNLGSAIGATAKFGADLVNAHQYDKTADDLSQEAGRGLSSVGDFNYEIQNSANAADERARVKKLNTQSTLGAMGSGAAAGAAIGSLFPGLGTVIGGAVGGIAGLVGGLFGGASRKRKMERALRKQQVDANIKNEFNRMGANTKQMMLDQYKEIGDQNSQYLYGFREGKSPVYSTFGPTNAKPDSRVSKGEVALNLATGDAYRIPTGPNDTALFAGGKDPNVAIITNKYGLSDYAMVDPMGAIALLGLFKNNGMLKRSREGFDSGKIPATPNIITSGIGAMAGLAQYFGAKNDKVYRPNTYYSNPNANRALSTLAGLRVNELPIINQLRDAEARGTYALNNSGGLSGALRYLGKIANVRNTQQSIADALFKAQVQNNQYGAAYANALLQEGAQEATNLMNARRADDDVYMKSHAARQQGMQMGIYNFINYLQNMYSNEFKRQRFNNMYNLYAEDVKNRAKAAKSGKVKINIDNGGGKMTKIEKLGPAGPAAPIQTPPVPGPKNPWEGPALPPDNTPPAQIPIPPIDGPKNPIPPKGLPGLWDKWFNPVPWTRLWNTVPER